MKMIRNTLLGATILMGVGTSSAWAQEPAAEGEPAGGSGEIVVTATRRATSLQDVPINISAVGAEQLSRQRIDDVRDIADFTPGMTISDTGPGSTGTIVLRGLNASDTDTTGASYDDSLGVYLGEVPIYYDFKMLDIARVETLLGPQGTLYGLGTLAGAIRNIPNRPDLTAYQAEAHGRAYGKSHSSQVGYQADGMINIPLVTDHIAFRSATGYFYDPGFIDYPLLLQTPGVSLPQPSGPDGVTEADYAANLKRRKDLNFERTFTTRNQLLFQLNEDLKVNFTYAYQQTKTDGGQYNSNGVLGTGKYESAGRYVEPVNRHAHLGSMEVNANLGGIADLVATTAYTTVKNRAQSDNTDLLLDLDYGYETFPAFSSWNESEDERKQFNQEVRLVSRHGGPFSWVLGGFYNQQKRHRDYIEHVPNHPWVEFGTQPNPDEVEYASYVTSKVTEKAIFGEGTFRVTPAWQVTAGARYFGYNSKIAGALVVPLIGDPVSPYDLTPAGGTAKKTGWVWKFNSSFNFTPDIMLYGTYSKGYRIGGPNSVAPCPNPLPNDPDGDNINNTQLPCGLPNEVQYGPDTTRNAEIGLRAQLFERKLTFNFNVFQIKWDGIQVDSATLNGIVGITVNGGKAKSEGFETSFQLRPVDRLSIQGTYSYVNARLTEDVPDNIPVNDPAGTYPSAPTKLDALAGDRLPGSAKNSGSLGVTYTMPFKDGQLVADWTATYRGNVVTRLGWDRAYGDKLPGYVLHRASLTYDTDRYSIGLFANNIFDKYAVASVANDRSRVGLNDGVVLRYYKRTVINPRTVGIEARFRY
ncbi:TonB-dependent receptor [Novosphingobium aromaticivorans DSM 12444]|uniref:TonB-dependent receptor n=1 Tax=Novosphingobium aromaticivorans (strain ATCC 700278 / DSM 12444 / CCUG 56034 / CIP 105152 / NBRC 16084 / F199) TaxID=279238 RepID=Q2GAR3_NOVAD|nr:TonB-dependent receptor [Novosphingobium aromaticivorans]ABD25060.1 TonB-dependent receptor [Novosphingobium aromaticivorans DSM 12444]